MNIFDPIPQYQLIAIMPTFRCTSSCANCSTMSNKKDPTFLPESDIISALEQAASLGYKVVVFTGGEPSLADKALLAGIRKAREVGLSVRIVTNAHWATDTDKSDRVVNKWADEGISEINFSTGDEHSLHVSLDNIVRAVCSSVKAGLDVAVMIENSKDRRITRNHIEDDPMIKELQEGFPDATLSINESPWMPLDPFVYGSYPDGMTVDRSNISMRRGCDSILTATTVFADGSIAPCCGLGVRRTPELCTGNIKNIDLPTANRRAEDDFLKRWLRVEGPEHILAWASEYNAEIKWESLYAHRCQACMRIYKDPLVKAVIFKYHKDKFADVVFGEWLLYHYQINSSNETQEVMSSM